MPRFQIDGLGLHAEIGGSGPPVVMLHGFTGAASSWDALANELAGAGYTTIAPDFVGHGASEAPSALERYEMRRVVGDLVSLLGEAGYERAAWLGYSMGGRTALQVAVHHPEAVAALILESASPGLESADERTARVASDEELAARIEGKGVPAFVEEWERLPLFASQSSLEDATRARLRAQRLANRAKGLANSLRGMGTGVQEALHSRLGEVAGPTLVLAGELDQKFVEIGELMARTLPNARMQVVGGAGHATHLERPAEFAAAVLEFLRRTYLGREAAP